MDLPEPTAPDNIGQPPPKPLNGFSGKKRRIVAGCLTILALVAVAVTFYLLQNGAKSTGQSAVNIQTSPNNLKDQQVIKNLTGFDWSNLPTKLNGSEKQALAVLLLLYSEETDAFRPEITAANLILPEDINKSGLVELNSDPTGENLQKLIENLIAIETIYQQKGLMPAQTHIARLNILKTYFVKKLPQKKYKVPAEAKEISGGIVIADNHLDYSKTLITRYNNWLRSQTT